MRWKRHTKTTPALGTTRVVTKFLFLPKCLGNECKWLETASIRQIYTRVTSLAPERQPISTEDIWIDREWVGDR